MRGLVHPDQHVLNATQNSLCRAVNRRRGRCACRASNCRRRARFSRTRSSRERKALTNQPRKCRSDTIMARIVAEKSESSFSPSHSFCRCTTFWRGTTVGQLLSSPYCTQILFVRIAIGYRRSVRRFLRSTSCSSMLAMRRSGDRNVVARNRSNMVCKSTSPWAAARSNAASVPTTFNPRCRAIVTPSRSSINRRMACSSDASDIASRSPASRWARAESMGCFRLTTSNHWGGCQLHARTIAGVFAWISSALTEGGDKNLSI